MYLKSQFKAVDFRFKHKENLIQSGMIYIVIYTCTCIKADIAKLQSNFQGISKCLNPLQSLKSYFVLYVCGLIKNSFRC